MSKYKDRMRDQREQEVIEAARQLLAEKGFANFNMEEVAERVGISKPTLYQHFDSREALLVQIFIEYFHALGAAISELDHSDPLETLKNTLRLMLTRRYSPGGVMLHFSPELHKLIFSSERLTAMREGAVQHFTELIERAKAEGQVNPDLPSSLISRYLFILQAVLAEQFHETPSEAELDQAINHVIRLLTHGIQA